MVAPADLDGSVTFARSGRAKWPGRLDERGESRKECCDDGDRDSAPPHGGPGAPRQPPAPAPNPERVRDGARRHPLRLREQLLLQTTGPGSDPPLPRPAAAQEPSRRPVGIVRRRAKSQAPCRGARPGALFVSAAPSAAVVGHIALVT